MSTRQTTDERRIESIRIGPDDPRYHGEYPEIDMGGHVVGGAFGFL